MTSDDRELLVRIDERTIAIHEKQSEMQTQVNRNSSTCSRLKGAAWTIAVILVPLVIAVIGAHLK